MEVLLDGHITFHQLTGIHFLRSNEMTTETTKIQKYKCWACQNELNVFVHKKYFSVQTCSKCLDEARRPIDLIKEALDLLNRKDRDDDSY